jgi:membrane protease YdiL (CAAX protease family)
VTARFWPPAALPEGSEKIAGNIKTALVWLGIVWSFAAFGEEIGYRGSLIRASRD